MLDVRKTALEMAIGFHSEQKVGGIKPRDIIETAELFYDFFAAGPTKATTNQSTSEDDLKEALKHTLIVQKVEAGNVKDFIAKLKGAIGGNIRKTVLSVTGAIIFTVDSVDKYDPHKAANSSSDQD